MKFCHFVTPEVLTVVAPALKDSTFMLESCMLNMDDIKRFKSVKRILIDCSTGIHQPINPDTYYNYVKELEPEACFLPDVLDNGSETIKMFDSLGKKFLKLPLKWVIAVVQGNNISEWKECFKELRAKIIAEKPLVEVRWGLAYRTGPASRTKDQHIKFRTEMHEALKEMKSMFKIHYAGLWSLDEIKRKGITSVDSSWTMLSTLKEADPLIYSRKSTDFLSSMKGKEVNVSRFIENISVLDSTFGVPK